jgi:hypothetical protein
MVSRYYRFPVCIVFVFHPPEKRRIEVSLYCIEMYVYCIEMYIYCIYSTYLLYMSLCPLMV